MGIRYSALCDIGRQRETNQDSVYAGSRLPAVADGWGSRTRAYLLRGGELFQITHDHTVVQSLLDEGRITPEEAISHPQRSLLLRGIDGTQVTADTSLHDACVGDRYLLCSDGLTAVVATREIEHTPRVAGSPDRTVRQLVALANHGGGPDNIGCVVADVVDLDGPGPRDSGRVFGARRDLQTLLVPGPCPVR